MSKWDKQNPFYRFSLCDKKKIFILKYNDNLDVCSQVHFYQYFKFGPLKYMYSKIALTAIQNK
jgi:hypothetical protein